MTHSQKFGNPKRDCKNATPSEVLVNENGEILVSGRELHEFLGVTERYNSWFTRMLQYGFIENVDFTSVKTFTVVNNGARREIDDHALKLDMAKEMKIEIKKPVQFWTGSFLFTKNSTKIFIQKLSHF